MAPPTPGYLFVFIPCCLDSLLSERHSIPSLFCKQAVTTPQHITYIQQTECEYIARALWQAHGRDADVRQCVQIARLSRRHKERIDEVLMAPQEQGLNPKLTTPSMLQ